MIALIISIVIFAFVIYNFYKDYKNWSNVGGSFAEGLSNSTPASQNNLFNGWDTKQGQSVSFSSSERGDNDKDIKGKTLLQAKNEAFPVQANFDKEVWAVEWNESQKWALFRTKKAGNIPTHSFVSSPGWSTYVSPNLPASTWKSGGSCPEGCKEPICVDGNCKNVTVDNKSYKGCSGTCGNVGGGSGCRYDSQCTAENCGVKYFEEGDKTPCKENKRWDNSAWENTQDGGYIQSNQGQQQMGPGRGLKSQDQGQKGGVRDPIQPSGEGRWIGAPPTRGVYRQQGGQQYGTQQQYGGQRQYSGQQFGAQQQRAKPQSYTLFNKQIMTQVLANKNLLPSDIPLGTENQHSYIRIGKNFMHDVARIRNISLPLIKENDYESLGRIASRVLSRKEKGIVDGRLTGSESQLMNAVNGILSSSQLNSSIIQGNTIPQTSTTSRTTGLMGDKTNAGMGSGDHETGRGMPGLKGKYTDSYKPVDDKVFPRPYDSVWSIFY